MKINIMKKLFPNNFKKLGIISLMFPIMIVISSPSMALGPCTLVACQCSIGDGDYKNIGRYSVPANQSANDVCISECPKKFGVWMALCITTAP